MGQIHDNFKVSIDKVVESLKSWIADRYAPQEHTHDFGNTDHNHDSDYALVDHTHTISNIEDIEILSLIEYNNLTVKDNKVYICLE